MTEAKAAHVYQAINAITAEMADVGIPKNIHNKKQDYMSRGIDDVYSALAARLAKHNLCILPRVTTWSVVERRSNSGGALFCTTLEVEFDFVSSLDGSAHVIRTVGEAMDASDKSSNKAMSAAYKYAALMTFCIPTGGDNDTENHTHEVAAVDAEAAARKAVEVTEWLKAFGAEIRAADTPALLEDLVVKNETKISELAKASAANHTRLIALIEKRREELSHLLGD